MHLSLSKLLSRKYAVVVHLTQHNVLTKSTAKRHVLRFSSCWEGSLIKPALKKNDKQMQCLWPSLWYLCGSTKDNGILIKTHWAPQASWASDSCTSKRNCVLYVLEHSANSLLGRQSWTLESMWISDGWVLSLASSGPPCPVARPVTV